MRARLSRRRLVVGLAAGVACSFVVITFAFAQYSRPDNGTCTWHGWSPDLARNAAVTLPELQPGERVTVQMSNSCSGVGIINDFNDQSAWIIMRRQRNPLKGDGFTVEAHPEDRSSFTVTVNANAAPGRRSLWSSHLLGRLAMTEMPFIVGSTVHTENTKGFCCRNEGSRCDAGSTQASCDDGNTWVPFNTSYSYDEKSDFCDYRICGVPGQCYTSNADTTGVGTCATISQAECREKRGEFHGDWSDTYCLAYARTNASPYRYYCHPSGAAELMDEFGEEIAGAGVCERVSPSDVGTYFPEDAGGFAYDPPVEPTYDTFTRNEIDCTATCGDYACLYLPIGDTVARGCANRLVVGSDGTLLYPPEYLPPLPRTALNGLTLSAAEDLVPYHLALLRPGAKVNEDGAFDTEPLCDLACPPCTGATCFGMR